MVRSACALALLLASTNASAISPGFKAKADALLAKAYATNGPGAAVIVTENGQTIYTAGRGMADIAAKRPITPATVFRIGSITKQFTAATILRLAEQGKLSLDDPLSKFLPDYPAPGSTATVRQLLNHTSGVMPYTAIPGFMTEANTNKPYTTPQLIAVFKNIPSPSKPGQQWAYNNSGYVLLGAIIEKVSGKPWDEAVGGLVAGPLKLASIRSGIGEETIPGMAKGYTEGEHGQQLAGKIHMSVPGGAGALVGTVADLATFGNALHNGKLLSPASYDGMTGTTTTSDGKTAPYGYGIESGDIRGRRELGHSGGIFGFSTDSVYLPKEKVFVAVFANSDSPTADTGTVTRRLAALAMGDPYPTLAKAALDFKAVEPMFGVYKFNDTERTFFARGGKLYTKRAGGGEIEAYSAGGNKFFYGPDDLTFFEVTRVAKGMKLVFHREGNPKGAIGIRTGPVPAASAARDIAPATLDSYAGRFTSAAGIFVFKHEGDGLTVKLGAQPAFPLKATSATEFEIAQVGAKIRFNVKDGKAESITLFQGGQELEVTRSN